MSSEHAAEGGVVATHDVDTKGNSPNTNTSYVLQSHDTIQVPNNEQKPLKPINNLNVGQAVNDANMQISISFTNVFYADKTLNKMHFRTLNLKSSKSNDFELKIPMSLVIDVNDRILSHAKHLEGNLLSDCSLSDLKMLKIIALVKEVEANAPYNILPLNSAGESTCIMQLEEREDLILQLAHPQARLMPKPEPSNKYKFIVDGEWRHDEHQPFVIGNYGTVNTVFLTREPDYNPAVLSPHINSGSSMDVDNEAFQRVVLLLTKNLGGIDLSKWKELQEKGEKADMEKFVQHVQGNHFIPNTYLKLRAFLRQSFTHYFYEATVGAGLPIMHTLRDLFQTGDKIIKIEGIFSGTLSYIFNSFVDTRAFSEVVVEAKAAGHTEPDPRDDLAGTDVARKISLSRALYQGSQDHSGRIDEERNGESMLWPEVAGKGRYFELDPYKQVCL
ncbi:bifunctional aspartokinase/homoserine dehydrogenase I [Tanacetum coccineum]|uniref:Bifunctional aspartokinase/homoserine dehydrogenase I n=1 Tax=Tanacetum coccineum TaxID=301880 RepID=A0ABQ5J843_9ASTR